MRAKTDRLRGFTIGDPLLTAHWIDPDFDRRPSDGVFRFDHHRTKVQ